MKILSRDWFKKLRGLLATDRPEPAQQAERIVAMQRDVVLPSKAGVCLVVLCYLVYSGWYEDPSTEAVVLETLKHYFEIYLVCTVLGSIFFISWRRLPSGIFQWLAFTLGLLDGLFMAGLVILTGGFDSIAFWVFPALIVLNALSIPLAMPQIVLNVLLSFLYVVAVVSTPPLNPNNTLIAGVPGKSQGAHGTNQSVHATGDAPAKPKKTTVPRNSDTENLSDEIAPQQLLSRVSVLWLLTLCCYGAQVLSERQRQAILEAAEFAAREGQLHSAGRLAAEFAHQIKNPLAVINNAAYSLQRSLGQNKNAAAQQIEIIQEEVARADKVITQIMGYAQLSEGRVEKLKVVEEIERASEQVFPGAVPTGIKLKKKFTGPFPPLLMQRGHLAEILVNLMLNAREALAGKGNVSITAVCNRDRAVEIAVADDGSGIPPDKIGRIFEAYFTTKEKGTGLGLAIVKHNAELYGGTVRVESMLGKGAKFTVSLPAKLQPKPFAS
jgi:signal transduction histidine kinase